MNQQKVALQNDIMLPENIQDQSTNIVDYNKLFRSRILKYPAQNYLFYQNTIQKDNIKIQHPDNNIQATFNNKIVSNFKKYGESRSPQYQKIKLQHIEIQQAHERIPNFNIKTQNLKKISMHIKNIIQSNQFITIKHLSFLLYQIIGQTNLGQKIIQRNYQNKQKSIYQYLQDKYDRNASQYDLNFVVKNVRRRIYDSVNVMIATGIICKNNKNQLCMIENLCYISPNHINGIKKQVISYARIKKQTQASKRFLKQSYLNMKQLLAQRQEAIQNKRKSILSLKRRKVLLQKNFIRNRQRQLYQQNDLMIEQNDKISLPIMIINDNDQILMKSQQNQFRLHSPEYISIVSDTDILEYLLKQKINYIKQQANDRMQDFDYQ